MIVLVGPEIEESLALRYLAAAVRRADLSCRIVPFNRARDLSRVVRRVLSHRPALVALSLVAQRRYPDYQELVVRLRRRGYRGHITAGGHFAGLRAAEILRDTPGLDSILHHEGEERIVTLAGLVARRTALPGGLDGVSWRGPNGIDHVPPRRPIDLESLAPPLVASRGCAGSCSFCSIHAWHRQAGVKPLRFRAPEAVAAEMASLHREHGVRVFVFHDDDFLHPDRHRALERCRVLFDTATREIGGRFAFVLKSRPDRVDPEVFAYLKSRGLARVYLGIETHARTGIEMLNRRLDPDANVRALDTLQDLGVYTCFNLLLFHPETTIAEFDENLALLAAHRHIPFDVARTELYARSTLETRMIAEGRALGDYRGYGYTIRDPRAEALFSLWADALWERHFGESSILHRAQELGFRWNVLRHLEPATTPAETGSRVLDLIRDVNGDTIRFLEALREAVLRGAAPGDCAARLAAEAECRTRRQAARWAALSLELEIRAALGRAGLSTFSPAVRAPRLLRHVAAAAPSLALALATLGCPGSSTVCDPPPPPARFSTNIEPLLDRDCATSGCHAAADTAAGLNLASGASYDALVGVPSRQVPARLLVKPGDADSSYLVDKLEGTHLEVGGTGERMPPPPAEPAYDLWSRVATWIWQGAKRN